MGMCVMSGSRGANRLRMIQQASRRSRGSPAWKSLRSTAALARTLLSPLPVEASPRLRRREGGMVRGRAELTAAEDPELELESVPSVTFELAADLASRWLLCETLLVGGG
ncbi:hypothetical protein AAFF_G00331410 [Aldrovandia affinis]|uniref:Uncharacterized protein n=1 Tax=Aldrovandia affinis TaxID=143900 RepID=A0AAD7SLB3_9TELE|nr:hypothetical protein AAFF_G00331410 [Aldrovandia affinis]